MKVLLINIALRPDTPVLMPPLGLAYIATAIHNSGFDLEILDIDAHRYSDEVLETQLKEKSYDIVALGCIVTAYKYVKRIARIVKKYKNAIVIAGNSVASSISETLLTKTDVDIAVMGEGDITIVQLLNAIKENKDLKTVDGIAFMDNEKIFYTNPQEPIKDIDKLPFINWSLFDIDLYIEKSKLYTYEPFPIPYETIKLLPINTARGCLYNCSFCYNVFKNYKYRVRSAENICNEIEELKDKYDINYISLHDELSFYSAKHCEQFADTLIKNKLNIFWKAACRSDLLKMKDFHIVNKLKEAGCIGLGFSLESANKKILQAMNKKTNVDDFKEQVAVVRKGGLAVWTSIVVGYPQETEDTLYETFACCEEAEVYPSVGFLIPLPGTPIYEYAIQTGAIKNEEDYLMNAGDRQDFRINLTTMKTERIKEIVKTSLMKISDKLKLNLDESKLIKTGRYKHKTMKK